MLRQERLVAPPPFNPGILQEGALVGKGNYRLHCDHFWEGRDQERPEQV